MSDEPTCGRAITAVDRLKGMARNAKFSLHPDEAFEALLWGLDDKTMQDLVALSEQNLPPGRVLVVTHTPEGVCDDLYQRFVAPVRQVTKAEAKAMASPRNLCDFRRKPISIAIEAAQ